jgi:uncharacterized protein YodC (DUF2158 family)
MSLREGIFRGEDLEVVALAPGWPQEVFEVGSRVRLASGGPTMIVTGLGPGTAVCRWRTGAAWFPFAMLDLVDGLRA